MEEISDFDFEIVHVPGVQNILADALSCLYSNEACGTVCAASEYLLEEDGDRPAKLILSLISAPCYTGRQLFLGAAQKRKVPLRGRVVFPNVKQVMLKLKQPTVPLEGEPAPVTEEPESIISSPEVSMQAPQEYFTHLAQDDAVPDSLTAEILSKAPVGLTELMDAGDLSLDIHRRLVDQYSKDAFFKMILEDPVAHKNFQVSNGLIFVKEKDCTLMWFRRTGKPS